VVFQLTPDSTGTVWTETVLYSFCSQAGCADGKNPSAGLIMDASGNLYGTTNAGGNTSTSGGTVFQLTPDSTGTAWTETVLHSFCSQTACGDGSFPTGDLIMDASGNLYGTTARGGGFGRQGLVFQLTPDSTGTVWTETVLYSFCRQTNCADGAGPIAGLLMDASGNLYGTTNTGGNFNNKCAGQGCGTVFKIQAL
jgi:hypothetical protein